MIRPRPPARKSETWHHYLANPSALARHQPLDPTAVVAATRPRHHEHKQNSDTSHPV